MTERKPYTKLNRVPGSIRVREAGLKYGIPHRTLSDWIASGLIRVIERPQNRGQAMLILEADVAEAARHYTPGPGRGRQRKIAEAIAGG